MELLIAVEVLVVRTTLERQGILFITAAQAL
jgi:hypothetical protein